MGALMKCKATTKSGNPCKANAMHGSDYCVTHARITSGEKKAEESPPKPIDESKTSGATKAQTQNISMKTGGGWHG